MNLESHWKTFLSEVNNDIYALHCENVDILEISSF